MQMVTPGSIYFATLSKHYYILSHIATKAKVYVMRNKTSDPNIIFTSQTLTSVISHR
jgi:hypothetical protein